MSSEPQVLYAAVMTLPGAPAEVATVALMQPPRSWFYAEVVDLDLQRYSDREATAISAKLRMVPGTTFVQRADLGAAMMNWLEQCRGPEQEVRVETELARKVLMPILEDAYAAAGRKPEVTWRICRFSNTALRDFYRHSGGRHKGRSHSLIDALGLAFCDLDRRAPMQVERIHHLEMVMGTKGALGYRAWGRRYESVNPRLAAATTPTPA